MREKLYYIQRYKPDNKVYDVHYTMFFSAIEGKILDVGCSTGNFLIHCSEDSSGVEGDEESVKMAKNRGLNVQKCDLDKEKLPFADDYFDAVNYISVIEHLRDPLPSLMEIRRVLKQNGKLVLRTKNLKWWKFRFWDNYNNYSPFTKKSLEHILIDAGYRDFRIKYIKRGMFGAQIFRNLGLNPLTIKKMMLFFGYLKRQYLLVELKNKK